MKNIIFIKHISFNINLFDKFINVYLLKNKDLVDNLSYDLLKKSFQLLSNSDWVILFSKLDFKFQEFENSKITHKLF